MTCYNTELHDRKGVGLYRSSVRPVRKRNERRRIFKSCDIEETQGKS